MVEWGPKLNNTDLSLEADNKMEVEDVRFVKKGEEGDSRFKNSKFYLIVEKEEEGEVCCVG